MASVGDYKDFGKSLSDYVRVSSASELTSAFKEGGALHNALESLNAQEEELNKYQESLLESFHPGQEGSLSQEQINEQIEKNDTVRNEIAHLRARLNDLSESVGASKSNWNISKAKSEFVKGVEQGLKVENSFFETLVNAIKNAFSFTNKKKLEEAKTNLGTITTDIQNKTDDRVKVPSKGKLQELEQSKGIESPTLSIESGKVNTPDMETKSNIPEPPPPPPLPNEKTGVEKSSIPEPPPPPPLQSEKVGVEPKNVSAKTSSRENLLEQIRNRRKKPKLSKDHMNEKGERDFVYVKSEEVRSVKESGSGIMDAMREQMEISGEINPNSVLNGKDKEAQMNMLYSAMVDGNDKLVEAFKTHETGVDSGRVDDWDEPIMEPKPTFSKEDIESIEQAAIETKQRIEKGEDLPDLSGKKSSTEVEDVQVSSSEPSLDQSDKPIVKETVEVEKSTISSDIPEPPPLPPSPSSTSEKTSTKSPKSKVQKEEVSAPRPDTSSLLQEIRDRAGKGLRSVESQESVSLDMDGFTYVKSSKPKKHMSKIELAMAQRRGAIAGNDDLESQLEMMSEQEQLDMLYSAVIDDDQKKISAIYNACDDEVFTPEAVTKVCEAAMKIAATQSNTKKVRIEKAIQKVGNEFDVEVATSKTQSVGR